MLAGQIVVSLWDCSSSWAHTKVTLWLRRE